MYGARAVTDYLHPGRKRSVVRLGNELSSDGLRVLLQLGLRHKESGAVAEYEQALQVVRREANETLKQELDQMITRIDGESKIVEANMVEYLTSVVMKQFPSVNSLASSRREP